MSSSLKCPKCASPMKEALTRKGIQIDVCVSCRGVWFDKGELNLLIKNPARLQRYHSRGLKNPSPVKLDCPHCQKAMQRGGLLSFEVEECPFCFGLFLDREEFEKIRRSESFQKLEMDSVDQTLSQPYYPFKMPSLALTTTLVCGGLYGLLFGVIVFLVEKAELSMPVAWGVFLVTLLVQFYFSPIILDWQLRLFGSLNWVPIEKLESPFKETLIKLCQKSHIPLPKMGIIEDGSPSAYTYGRTPWSARVVFSRGMFQLLDEDEMEAVLAHELGHIKHWDFVLMTVIKIVPMVLYNIYSGICHALDSKDSKNKGGAPLLAAAVIAYISYIIAEYLVLFVSRVREYYADQFSCFISKKPNSLIKALVKISYGLLHESEKTKSMEKKDDKEKDPPPDSRKQKSFESFNIMNISNSQVLALNPQDEGGFQPEAIKNIMRWDLWNPWAFYYELKSTHPLTAKRINAISSHALALKQKPYLVFNKKRPESFLDDFLGDIFILFLPWLLGLLGAGLFFLFQIAFYNLSLEDILSGSFSHLFLACIVLAGLSLGSFIKTIKAYPGGDQFYSSCISSLLKVVKVSPVRSYPVTLKGKILGRGEAGSVFSEDFFLRDKTGMIFLNHEPFGFNFLFALLRFKKFQGQEVTATGWFRRAPAPYIEIREIRSIGGRTKSYTYNYKMAFPVLGFILSLILFLTAV